jgi:hypothetical protein
MINNGVVIKGSEKIINRNINITLYGRNMRFIILLLEIHRMVVY